MVHAVNSQNIQSAAAAAVTVIVGGGTCEWASNVSPAPFFKWLLHLQRFDGSTVMSPAVRRHLPGGQRWVAKCARRCWCFPMTDDLVPRGRDARSLFPSNALYRALQMSSCSSRALTILSTVFGACGLLLVGVAVSTDYWLIMVEGIILQQNQSMEVKMALHSGLWRVCFVAGRKTQCDRKDASVHAPTGSVV